MTATTAINAYDAAHETLKSLVVEFTKLGWYVVQDRSNSSNQYLNIKQLPGACKPLSGGPMGICLSVVGHSRDPKIHASATWGPRDWLGRYDTVSGGILTTTMVPTQPVKTLADKVTAKVIEPYCLRWAEMLAENKAKYDNHKKALELVHKVGRLFKLSKVEVERRIDHAQGNKVQFFFTTGRVSVFLDTPRFVFDYVNSLDERHLNIIEAFVETGDE